MTQARVDGGGGGPDLIDMLGGRLEIVGRADAPNADVVIMRGAMPPGGSVPLHSHDDYECFHVLSGQLDVFIGACRKRSAAEIIFSEQDVTRPIHRLMTRFVEADAAL